MDRRKMLALLGASPALVAGAPSFPRTAPKAATAAPEASHHASDNSMVIVLNPAIEAMLAERIPLAPRLHTLEGKTIYLVDTGWEGRAQISGVIQEMQAWFTQQMPGVKLITKMKKGNFENDDPALWKEIASSGGNGIIIGVAG